MVTRPAPTRLVRRPEPVTELSGSHQGAPLYRAHPGVRLFGALALAAVALLWLLQHSLQSAADAAASSRAEQLSARLLTDPVTEIDPTLLATDGRTTVIQVIDAAG